MNRSILAIYISTVGVYRQYVYISLYRTIIYTNIYNYIGIYSLIYVVPSDIFVSYKLVPEVRMSYKLATPLVIWYHTSVESLLFKMNSQMNLSGSLPRSRAQNDLF